MRRKKRKISIICFMRKDLTSITVILLDRDESHNGGAGDNSEDIIYI